MKTDYCRNVALSSYLFAPKVHVPGCLYRPSTLPLIFLALNSRKFRKLSSDLLKTEAIKEEYLSTSFKKFKNFKLHSHPDLIEI